MNAGSVKTKDYENKRLCGLRENKPNSNPKQTQSNPISLAILSAEFRSTAKLAASAEAQSYYSTSSIGRSWVTQQLAKITAQNQKYTIRYTFSPVPCANDRRQPLVLTQKPMSLKRPVLQTPEHYSRTAIPGSFSAILKPASVLAIAMQLRPWMIKLSPSFFTEDYGNSLQ